MEITAWVYVYATTTTQRCTSGQQLTFRQGFGSTVPNKTLNALLHGIIFTNRFYYESFEFLEDAMAREKYIKGKNRKWKEALINSMNPDWKDLTEEVDLIRGIRPN